jgi:hypothetical protein
MTAMAQRPWAACICVPAGMILIVLWSTGTSLAAEEQLSQNGHLGREEQLSQSELNPRDQVRSERVVVLRLSNSMLTSLMNRQLDRVIPVSDVVLGTPVTGTARITGQARLHLAPSNDQARFQVTFSGTVHSRTVANGGPAIVHGHSVTRFTATKEIVFEPGRGFYALPPQVNAQTECFTDSIQSTRSGLIGRVVQRRAQQRISDQKDTVTKIAREKAVQRIKSAFENHVDARLARLNRAVELRTLLVNTAEDEVKPRLACSTTPYYLQIGTGPLAPSPIEIPVLATTSVAAPIEVWVHGSIVPEKVSTALERLQNKPDQSKILNALALLPGTLGKEIVAATNSFLNENRVTFQSLGAWFVIKVNPDFGETLVADARPIRR